MILKIIVIVLLITSFWNPTQVSWIYLVSILVLESFLFLASKRSSASPSRQIKFDEKEQEVFKKYNLYFRYPRTSTSLSSSLSLIALSAFILTPWFLYNNLWVAGITIALNYFVAQSLSSKLNIRFYLHDAVEKLNREEYREEMDLVDSVCEKIMTEQERNQISSI